MMICSVTDRRFELKKGIAMHWLVLIVLAILNAGLLLAQEDEEMPPGDGPECMPASFETGYDKFKSDSITTKQIQIWYSFGQEEYKHEQWKRAIPYYWKVLVNDPGNTYKVVYSKLAKAYFELTKSEEANKTTYLDSTLLIVYRGLKKYPDYGGLHFRAGSIHRTLGRTQCAIPHYEALVEASPDEASYLEILSELYFQSNDERAIEMMEKVVKLDPNNSGARDKVIAMMSAMGMDPYEKMKSTFAEEPGNVDNSLKLGKEAYIRGEYKIALDALTAVLANDAQNLMALEYKAKTLEQEQPNAAIAEYNKILAIDPKSVETHCAVARVYGDQGKFSSARSNVYQAQRIDPNYGESYMVMGEILEASVTRCSADRSGKGYSYDDKLVFEKAAAEYKRAAAKDPNYASKGNSRYNQMKPFFRSAEDKHLNNYRENLKDPCYSWIN